MTIELPGHAYIPGKTERHPEDAFETLRQTVGPDQSVDELAQSDAFKAGLIFFDKGFYWESHEVLEPVWMVMPIESAERRFVQGLIQLANGRLKLLMERPKAALRLVDRARELVPAGLQKQIMTVSVEEVRQQIDLLEQELRIIMQNT